ncbi:hypothetical protein JTE90_002909 [Oedothorax gibbosus]|uniref:Probable glutamine--tRNA ligase n=1 Tax=Oedothorax gibbosus TaxID=931172 RepID=A0AAV6U9Q5_9ARAC|nr:hypothetical protein JTE90_002909 [Oedothorax gibbosus]
MEHDKNIFNKLITIGFTEQRAKEAAKNEKLCNLMIEIIDEANKFSANGISKTMGVLLYRLATTVKPQIQDKIKFIVKYIAEEKLNTEFKVQKAISYFMDNVTDKTFDEYCGVGNNPTPEDIERVTEEVISKYKDELVQKRYSFASGILMTSVRERLPFANGQCIKHEVDLQVLDLLGPKLSTDEVKPQRKIKEKKEVEKLEDTEPKTISSMMKRLNFHKPGENHKTDGYVLTPFTSELIKKHLEETGGKVITRFPPEPNGILHIGHAKAVNINFGYAQAHNGSCILRYDDTNPEKEEEKFFKEILEMVQWLGYQPVKITHSSDYFDQLYELAQKLIHNGLAYVCHQKQEELKGFNPPPSPWRERPMEESVQLFEDMKNGKIAEGEATLRMKLTLEEGKQDPVAYRIKFLPHHRSGDKWCIYPTYDFTHCICDSLENITHSLCTKEFQSSEYGRLNMNYTVISKRKILKLISEGIVRDWDDPRLFTLTALRRRGVPPEAIQRFCVELGVTGAQSMVDPQMLDSHVRDVLNTTAPRAMAVLDPLKVTIKLPFEGSIEVEVPNFPADNSKGTHKITFSNVIYIDQADFKEVLPNAQYKRLSVGQPVGLRHAGYVISVEEVIKDKNNQIQELRTIGIPSNATAKPKAFIHWVADPLACEIRLYDRLFKHKNPEDTKEVPGGFVTDCDPDSLIVKDALVDQSVKGAKVYDKFQFERVGFFSVDLDSRPDKLVFNQTVTLREDSGKE